MAKKNKSLFALLLIFTMFIFTACGIGEEIKQPASVSGDSSVTTATETADIPTESIEEETADNSSESIEEETAENEITIAETVLYDANNVKVTATGYEEGWMGPEIKILVENNSDKNALITATSVSANGYMLPSASLYVDVAAGKKANESLILMSSELEQSGITTLAELQFFVQLSDSETWDTIDTSELLTLTTSAAPYEQPVDDSGDVLYDSDGIKIICKGLKQDIIWDGTVVFYMENASGNDISIHAENVSVNDFMQDVGLWSDLRSNTKLIDGMSLIDLSDLEIENIDQIENIEFSLRIVDAESWDEIATTDVLTLNFN